MQGDFMWELSIELRQEFSSPADYIYSCLKKEGSAFGAVITKHEKSDFISILLACEDYDKARLKIFAQNAIIEAICTHFKADYLNKFLALPIKEGIYFKALKKALLNFDKETDSFIISKNLELEGNINLEAFYYFKLKNLREKWIELINIANENGLFLVNNENFIDLLKFLVDNLEISHDTINVYFEGDKYKLLDSRSKVVATDEDNEDLVCKLIDLSPRQINIYGAKRQDENFNLLLKIYEKRVNLF
jgi:hypothetical protein